MIRDFTEEARSIIEEAVLTSLSTQVRYYGRGASYESELEATVNILGQDCVMNFDALDAQAKSLSQRSRGAMTERDAIKKKLKDVFDNAREYDDTKSEKVLADKDTTADPYISSLKGLVNSINVGGLGKTREEVGINFGMHHSCYEDSIFGTTSGFAQRLEGVGGGLFKEFYDSINLVEPFDQHPEQLENLKKFLSKDPSEVTDWERDAILVYLDSCVTTNETNGITTVDYEKISQLLTLCYTEEDYNILAGFRSYTIYYANDMLGYIAEQYNEYYQFKADNFQYLHYSLEGYANLNAILTATNTFYQELHMDGLVIGCDENTGLAICADFGIVVSQETEDPRLIVIDTVENDKEEFQYFSSEMYDDTKHNIYITPAGMEMNWSDSYKKKINNEYIRVQDALVNKLVGDVTNYGEGKVTGAIEGAIKSTGPYGVVGVAIYKQAKSYYDVIQDTNEANNATTEKLNLEYYRDYTTDLAVGGQTAVCGKQQVIAINSKINVAELETRVAYYNLTHQDSPITSEQVVNGFQNFVQGSDENREALDALSNSRGANTNYAASNGQVYYESDFRDGVAEYIRDHYNIRFENATSEQINNAITYVSSHPEYMKNDN